MVSQSAFGEHKFLSRLLFKPVGDTHLMGVGGRPGGGRIPEEPTIVMKKRKLRAILHILHKNMLLAGLKRIRGPLPGGRGWVSGTDSPTPSSGVGA